MKTFSQSLWKVPTLKGGSNIRTTIPPEHRSFKNLPRRTCDNKPRVRFQDWLGIKGEKRSPKTATVSFGKSTNGKWYGWSHRAVHGFGVGDKVGPNADIVNNTGKEYTIDTEAQAKDHAIRFARSVA